MSTPTPTHTAVQPCPFCGSPAVLVNRERLAPPNGAFVECNSCGASQNIVETAAEAVARWNRRASLPQGEQPCKDRCQYAHDIGMQEYSCRNGCMYDRHAQGAIQDSRPSSVAPGGQPLAQPNFSKEQP